MRVQNSLRLRLPIGTILQTQRQRHVPRHARRASTLVQPYLGYAIRLLACLPACSKSSAYCFGCPSPALSSLPATQPSDPVLPLPGPVEPQPDRAPEWATTVPKIRTFLPGATFCSSRTYGVCRPKRQQSFMQISDAM